MLKNHFFVSGQTYKISRGSNNFSPIVYLQYIYIFTFMHLVDAFIQSDLQCIIHGYTFFFYQYVCSLGIEPTTFALLKQCSTTEPQGHSIKAYIYAFIETDSIEMTGKHGVERGDLEMGIELGSP